LIFLTVGTQLAFPRLLDDYARAARELMATTFAQTADPSYSGPIPSAPYLTRGEFEDRCAQANVIVGHAGMGTILAARRHRKPLIVVPRRHRSGEHRNDHQMDTARRLRQLGGVAVAETPEALAQALANPPAPPSEAGPERTRLISAVEALLAGATVSELTPGPLASSSAEPTPLRQAFLGLRFDCLWETEAAAQVLAATNEHRFAYVVTPNVDHIVTLYAALDDEALWSAYRDADLRLNDSRVLEILALVADRPLTVVPGSDLTRHLLARGGGALSKVAIVGATPEIVEALSRRYPTIQFTAHHPPFGVRHDAAAKAEIMRFVEETNARLTFFAIGAPQSELICHAIAQRGRARTVALCVGSGLEFLSGHKRRAPEALRSLRLEWLFRLIQEPERLARRYLVKGPKILPIWLKHRRMDWIR